MKFRSIYNANSVDIDNFFLFCLAEGVVIVTDNGHA
uniref:Uncharacterized protein n=1 Tax=Brassica napus TaxID=3708 RepID=I7DE05_BRANA|nr:hypothetical protein [Brassica napus]